jgi:uncharacterized protein YbbC (DUF1343 family)
MAARALTQRPADPRPYAAATPRGAAVWLLTAALPALGGSCEHRSVAPPATPVTPFRTGLESLVDGGCARLRDRAVGVVTNPTGSDREFRSLPDIVASAPEARLVAVFGPEHGATGTAAAGDAVGDARDPRLGVPIYSLYGATRRPTKEMLRGIDLLLFDLQDVGVRTYTYLSTLVEVLTAAAEANIEVMVLDRPNPLGGDVVEGPVLEAGRESFVGAHTLPLRHGLTVGEFARLANAERNIGARLSVVPMEGYRRDARFGELGLAWIPPSPNIPNLETALVYAGMVLVEGTNLSEGRGTALPFLVIGAPWVDGLRLAAELNAQSLPGCRFRGTSFVPSQSKFSGRSCSGVQVHVLDAQAYLPVRSAVALLLAVRRLWPGDFRLEPATLDRLAGGPALRAAVERSDSLDQIEDAWRPALESYLARRQPALLYPRRRRGRLRRRSGVRQRRRCCRA